MLRALQAADVLRVADLCARLDNTSRATVTRWPKSAVRRGYAERVDHGKYVVVKEVLALYLKARSHRDPLPALQG